MKYPVIDYITKNEIDFVFDNPFTGKIGEAFERFHSVYEPDLIVTHPAKKPKLAKKGERACRFCLKESSKVTFNKIAHVIPQLTGNRHIIHDCECDSCNTLFGTYEDSFSKYLGMMRTTDFLKGQSGVPSFKCANGKFTMRHSVDKEGTNLIKLASLEKSVISEDGTSIIITAIKQSYIPLHIMKCFYKIGFSLIEPHDIPNFNPTRKVITGTDYDSKMADFAGVVKFSYPARAQSPMVVKFRKKKGFEDVKHPSTVLSLHFGKYTYQFFLIDLRDSFMFESGKTFDFIFSPPPFPFDAQELITEKIELSSTAKKVGEMDSVTFTFDDSN